jgi:hypothetical protein
MFQFTTTNVINDNKDYTTGLELWSTQEATDDKPASLNVKRHLNFKKPNVVSITKAEYVEPEKGKATLDLSTLDSSEGGNFRIAMYIRLTMSSQNSYYSNDLVFKGKPLYVEFVWKKGQDASKVAEQVAKIVKKYFITVYEKPIVKVTNSGTQVIIECTDEYQRFTKVDIEKYIVGEPYQGGYEVEVSAKTADDEDYDGKNTIVQGVEGFGTYAWILHNLRLPTANRFVYGAVNQDETPILGAKYNQYVIRYCVNRGIMGTDAVGEITKSLTTHVFYVNQNVASEFEAALATIAPEDGIETVPEESVKKVTEEVSE